MSGTAPEQLQRTPEPPTEAVARDTTQGIPSLHVPTTPQPPAPTVATVSSSSQQTEDQMVAGTGSEPVTATQAAGEHTHAVAFKL